MDNQTQPTKVVKPRIHSKAEVKALAQAEAKKSKAADLVKIVIALLVVAAAVWAFYALPQLNVYVRGLITTVGVVIALPHVRFTLESLVSVLKLTALRPATHLIVDGDE